MKVWSDVAAGTVNGGLNRPGISDSGSCNRMSPTLTVTSRRYLAAVGPNLALGLGHGPIGQTGHGLVHTGAADTLESPAVSGN